MQCSMGSAEPVDFEKCVPQPINFGGFVNTAFVGTGVKMTEKGKILVQGSSHIRARVSGPCTFLARQG